MAAVLDFPLAAERASPPPAATPAAPKHGATVGFLYAKLREDILRRELGPGSRLVENDLTQRFGVSRGPVRETLRRLAAEGLIEHVPNCGATVCRHSGAEVRERFQIRMALEPVAARFAAQNNDPLAREAFRCAISTIFDDSPREASKYLAENAAFHEGVLTLAGNKTLQDVVDRLQLTLLLAQFPELLSSDVLQASVREHRAIADAILQRDTDAAAAAMRAHLERAAALALS